MSDFLGHLAARSGWAEAGRLETLQPRLPSRFEPAGPGVAPGFADPGGPSDTDRSTSREATDLKMARSIPGSAGVLAGREGEKEPARTPALPGKNQWLSSAPSQTSNGLAEETATPLPKLGAAPAPEPARPAAATAPPEEPPVEEPGPRRRRRAALAPDPEDAWAASPLEPRVAAPRSAPPVEPAMPAAAPQNGARRAPAPAAPEPESRVPRRELPPEPAAQRLAPAPAVAPRPANSPAPQIAPPAPPSPPLPAAVRLEPKVTLAPPAPAPLPALRREARLFAPAAKTSPPAPTIQVTIGRLEVRAAPAPVAAAASTRKGAAPQVTLAEYLDRRSRGGQR